MNVEIFDLLEEKKWELLRPILASMQPSDIAIIFEDMDDSDIPIAFRILPKDLAADSFVEMDREVQKRLIDKLSDGEIRIVMQNIFADDAVDFLEEMPASVVKRVLAQSDRETREAINALLKYPKGSAGSIMTVEYVSFDAEMCVLDALALIRRRAIDSETIYTCYVTDRENHLIGLVTAKDLLLSSEEVTIGDIMNRNVIFSYTEDSREDVANKISRCDFLAMPIVDSERRLVGIVTVDDAIDVIREEDTEDIERMAAVVPYDRPYIKMSPLEIWKKRVPWLLVLLISATFTGLIISSYEEKLSLISSLLFASVPMMMDTGGNAGAQASVTVIRAIAVEELSPKNILAVIFKELRVALLLGGTLGLACFAKLLLIDKMIFGLDYTLPICAVVSLSLALTVVIAKTIGSSLPLIAKRLGLDPAVVASPFITTIVDAISLMIYCNLAIRFLG